MGASETSRPGGGSGKGRPRRLGQVFSGSAPSPLATLGSGGFLQGALNPWRLSGGGVWVGSLCDSFSGWRSWNTSQAVERERQSWLRDVSSQLPSPGPRCTSLPVCWGNIRFPQPGGAGRGVVASGRAPAP